MAKKRAVSLGIQREVIFKGHLPQEDLVELYNTADLYVRLSYYDGYPAPPLEAMACGCPVVVSDIGPLSEEIGDAGILANPYIIEEWVDSIYNALTNEELREDLLRKGFKKARMHSWEKTAKETIKVYEEVCES